MSPSCDDAGVTDGAELKRRIRDDPRALADAEAQAWVGRRWRNLFLHEAVLDEDAVEVATLGGLLRRDKRPPRQRIAEKFLGDDTASEWSDEMPPPVRPAPTDVTLVYAPGMLNGMLPMRAFEPEFQALSHRMGIRVMRADLHPMDSSEANIADLAGTLDEGAGVEAGGRIIAPSDQRPPGDVVLLGYSKGMPDVLELLVRRPDLAPRIRAIISWAGANMGSSLVDDLHGLAQRLEFDGTREGVEQFVRWASPVVDLEAGALRRLDRFHPIECLADLTTPVREKFFAEHREHLDALNIPLFGLCGSVAPIDVPYFQLRGALALGKLDRTNDMQLTRAQASLELPLFTQLATMQAHHWDMAFRSFPAALRGGSGRLLHLFPHAAALTASYHLLNELGLLDPRPL